MNTNLGDFIKNKIDKYLEKHNEKIKADLIREFGITTQYLNDIENNKRVPSSKLMKKMIEVLKLDNNSKIKLYDLASESHKIRKIPADIEEYILCNKDAKEKIRKLIQDCNS
mgnify:CR=1 FL=1